MPSSFFGIDAVGREGGVGQLLGVGGQVEIAFEIVATHRARLVHEILQDVEILLIHAARRGVVAHADPRGLAHDLAHHAAGAHDARAAERVAIHADGAARHEEIADVLAVEAAVRHGIAVLAVGVLAEFGAADEGIVREVLRILLLRVMQVLIPGRRHAAIGMNDAFDHVLAIERSCRPRCGGSHAVRRCKPAR
jgi:hypothetical protein